MGNFMSKALRKAIFLDRDGTINQDRGYVHSPEEWVWIPGAIEAIQEFKKAGYLVVVITNQAGIARGYYPKESMDQLHTHVNSLLSQYQTHIDAFYFCPHHPDFSGDCECRKPFPGMIIKAVQELGISISDSWLIGDKAADIQAGIAANLRCILVKTGYGEKESMQIPASIHKALNILDACQWVLKNNEMNDLRGGAL